MRTRLGLTVLLVTLAAGCGKGSPSPLAVITAAPAKTADAGTSRTAMTIDETVLGHSLTITGEGAFDYGARKGHFTMHLPAAAGLGGDVEAVATGSVFYIHYPASISQQLGGKPWVRFDLQRLGQQQGIDFNALSQAGSSSDPTQTLAYLRGASRDITKVGTETVRGTQTTRYHATLDLEKAVARAPAAARESARNAVKLLGTSRFPADVWVDGDGRARRMRFAPDLSAASVNGQPSPVSRMVVTVELFDFGVKVDVSPPPADQVTDLADVLRQAGNR